MTIQTNLNPKNTTSSLYSGDTNFGQKSLNKYSPANQNTVQQPQQNQIQEIFNIFKTLIEKLFSLISNLLSGNNTAGSSSSSSSAAGTDNSNTQAAAAGETTSSAAPASNKNSTRNAETPDASEVHNTTSGPTQDSQKTAASNSVTPSSVKQQTTNSDTNTSSNNNNVTMNCNAPTAEAAKENGKTNWGELIGSLATTALGLFGGGMLGSVAGKIGKFAKPLLGKVGNFFKGDTLKNVWGGVTGFFSSSKDSVSKAANGIGSVFGEIFSNGLSYVKNLF